MRGTETNIYYNIEYRLYYMKYFPTPDSYNSIDSTCKEYRRNGGLRLGWCTDSKFASSDVAAAGTRLNMQVKDLIFVRVANLYNQ